MTDENKDKKNGGDGDNGDVNPAAEAAKKLAEERKASLAKRAEDAERVTAEDAARARSAAASAEAENKYGVDLSGVEDAELRGEIKEALDDGKTMRKVAGDLATYGMQQARHAAALDIAIELEMLDSVKEIEASLKGAKTPAELELARREVRLELASDNPPAKPKGDGDEDPNKGKGGGRRFDGARGTGANLRAELIKKINAIDPTDPEAEKELEKLYGQVQESLTNAARSK